MDLNQKRILKKTGFTLVELLVSIFIIGLISSVAVYSHREFNDNLEISNLAYTMALSIREAQVSGGAVRGFETGSGVSFNYAYGIHFNPSGTNQFTGDNKAFALFVDISKDKIYGEPLPPNYPGFTLCGDPANNPECLNVTEIGRGNLIKKVCVRDSGVLTCDPVSIGGVDLTFFRPKLDTVIRFRQTTNGQIIGAYDDGNEEAIICLISPLGREKSVHILPSGQISVEDGTDCV